MNTALGFTGRIDEVRLYNRALNSSEVQRDRAARVLVGFEEHYETENEAGETTVATVTLNDTGPRRAPHLLMNLTRFGKEQEEQVSELAPAFSPKHSRVKERAYDFNMCRWDPSGYGFNASTELPPKFVPEFRREARELLVTEAKGIKSPQCHGEYDEYVAPHAALRWAVSASGVFSYRPGQEVWVKAENEPVCRQSGPSEPLVHANCEVVHNHSREHLDIIGDWRWKPGDFEADKAPLRAICAELDGVIPVNPLKQENAERIVRERSHFYHWLAPLRDEESLPCQWKLKPGAVDELRGAQ